MKQNIALLSVILSVAPIAMSCMGKSITKSSEPTPESKKSTRPNVVLIYVDDMGKGMLSFYGQNYVSTPNIDKIFQKGVSFNHAYGCIYCAPARASLLTGYHDCRSKPTQKFRISNAGIYKNKNYPFDDMAVLDAKITQTEREHDAKDIRLPANDFYLPQVFKKAGYTTITIGKNDYGFLATREQMKYHGWDHWYGFLDHGRPHGFYPPWIFDDTKVVRIPGNERVNCGQTPEGEANVNMVKNRWSDEGKKVYSEDLFIQKSIDFIRQNKDKPFFMMYTTPLPHGPTQVRLKKNDDPARYGDPQKFPTVPVLDPEILAHTVDASYKIGTKVPEGKLSWIEAEYAQMVKNLDESVGKIMDEVKAQGLEKNTVFVFTSDNGHEIYYSQPFPASGRVNKGNKKYSVTPGTEKVYNSADCHDIFNGTWGFSGRKWSTWNGGTNVPLAVYWPGKIEGGHASNELVTNYDFLPTMAELVGTQLESKKDGLSYLKLLKDPKASFPKERCIVYSAQTGYAGGAAGNLGAIVRNDGWVLLRNGALYRLFNPAKVSAQNPAGFDDKMQIHNVAKENPEIRDALTKELNAALTAP